MKLKLKEGTTSKIVTIFIQDSSSTTGAGLADLLFNSASLTGYWIAEGDATATQITMATMTIGTWATGGFIEVDATNLPGVYQIGLPDVVVDATSEGSVVVMFKGATNMAPVVLEIELDAIDYRAGVVPTVTTNTDMVGTDSAATAANLATVDTVVDAIKVKTDFLPLATAGAAGGVFIAGTNAATVVTASFTTTFTGNLTGSVGSVTGAVGSVTGAVGSVTGSVGSVTGAVGSVTGATGSVTGAVGSVAGNVGGNVTGSVGSLVGHTVQTTDHTAGIAAIPTTAMRGTDSAGTAANLATVDTVVDAIKVATDKLVFTVANQVDVNVLSWISTAAATPTTAGVPEVDLTYINGVAASAANLEKSAGTIVTGTVDTTAFTATTTILESDDITTAAADHYNGRIILFTSGTLQNQATDITDYELNGGRGKFTYTAVTSAPADDVTFVIV